jgi:general nucleoside transport system permease protein
MLTSLIDIFLTIGFFSASVRLAIPLVIAAMGEIVSERSGIVNIGLEGMMLAGALGGMVGAFYTGDVWKGLILGVLAGGMVAAVHAFVVITLAADQVVSGAALNIGVLGLTTFVYRALFGITERPIVAHFDPWPVPGLGEIPIIGPIFFNAIPILYLAYGAILLVSILLFRTRWGLGVQAVGEHPRAAESCGINVSQTRYAAVILCGLSAGLAGTFFSLGQLYTFIEGMTGGRGFIVLAVVIVANWSPWRAALVGLLFGAAEAIGLRIQALNLGIPYHFALAFPYVLTLLVYAGFAGRTRMPHALGQPYLKD